MTSVASIFLSHMDSETLNGPKAREHRPTATRARDIRWAREQLLGHDGVSILVLLHQLVLARDGHLEGARRRGRACQITLDSSFVRVIDIVLGNDGAFGQDGAKHGLEGERMTTYLMCLHDSEQASDRKEGSEYSSGSAHIGLVGTVSKPFEQVHESGVKVAGHRSPFSKDMIAF